MDRQIERLKWRFDNGYATEGEFTEKLTFLTSQRKEIASAAAAPVKMAVTGLVQAWDGGDNIVRLALLRNLFTELPISQGRILDYKPRPEVAEELDELVEGFPSLDSRRGLYGLRTPDLRLERPAS